MPMTSSWRRVGEIAGHTGGDERSADLPLATCLAISLKALRLFLDADAPTYFHDRFSVTSSATQHAAGISALVCSDVRGRM